MSKISKLTCQEERRGEWKWINEYLLEQYDDGILGDYKYCDYKVRVRKYYGKYGPDGIDLECEVMNNDLVKVGNIILKNLIKKEKIAKTLRKYIRDIYL